MINRAIEIDNPGGGDCGYYAMAIGLIPIMQTELGKPQNQRPILNKYLSFIPTQAEKQTLEQAIANYNIIHPDYRLLDKMMMDFRNILYNHILTNLNEKYDDNTHAILSDVLGVYYYLYNIEDNLDESEESEEDSKKTYQFDPRDACNTEFYHDHHFRIKMQEFVDAVKKREAKKQTLLPDAKLFKYIRINFFCVDNVKLDDSADVVRVLKKKTQQGHWATQGDINDLAHIFDIQLKTSGHGALNYPMQHDGRPIVRLHHPNAWHWTTKLNEVYVPDDKYKLDTKNRALTKQDIFSILNKYTNSSKAKLFHSRHHVALATNLKNLCNDANYNVNDVIQELIESLPENVKSDGHYFSVVKLLCHKAHQLPALEKKFSEVLTKQNTLLKKK